MSAIRRLLLRVLRVPGEPEPPIGAEWVRIFRAAPNYFRYKLALWVLAQVGALAGLVVFLFFLSSFNFEERWLRFTFFGVEWLSWAGYLLQLPFSYLLVRLDFEMRWYILSDRSLRIREGTLSLREKTLTYANIQQIAIRQNPLQRLLNIADVQVRTAGGGSGSGSEKDKESMHEAWFRGVGNAAEIRSAVRERVRVFRDSGLGDPDDVAPADASSIADAVEAAYQLHQEVRDLRNNLASFGSMVIPRVRWKGRKSRQQPHSLSETPRQCAKNPDPRLTPGVAVAYPCGFASFRSPEPLTP